MSDAIFNGMFIVLSGSFLLWVAMPSQGRAKVAHILAMILFGLAVVSGIFIWGDVLTAELQQSYPLDTSQWLILAIPLVLLLFSRTGYYVADQEFEWGDDECPEEYATDCDKDEEK